MAAQIGNNVLSRRQQCDLDWGLAVRDTGSNPEQAAIRQEGGQSLFHNAGYSKRKASEAV